MFRSRAPTRALFSLALPLAGAPIAMAFVTLWWPWLVVTGKTQIPFMSDTNVTYGVFCFTPRTGSFDIVKITGEFPHARYVSFMVYGGSRSQPFDALPDVDMTPDAGHINPFLPGADRSAPNRRYTVYAIKEGSGIDPSRYENALVIPASETFINLMMRIYRPDDGLDVYGGVPLPTVEVGKAGGAVGVPGYSLFSDLGALLKMFLFLRYREQEIFSRIHDDAAIEFYRLTREGGLPNADAPYLDTALGATTPDGDAKLAVLTFRPPTFERTQTSQDQLTGTTDVRYYSFCTSDIATGFNSQCISDSELTPNADGTVTLVVYPPVLEGLVKRTRVNRLVRGYSATTSLTYRQLLPVRDFAGSARHVPPLPFPLGDDIDLAAYTASNHIGDYAPTGFYLTGREFLAWVRRHRTGSQ